MSGRTVPISSVNGELRSVFEGTRRVGMIARRGGHWAAIAPGGRDVGLFDSEAQAARAVLAHASAVRAAH